MDTSGGKLDALQKRVLESLAAIRPPFILSGGAHAILAEKLCALLERSELRDLVDIEALVRAGQDLRSAAAAAPRRDGGFSPLTLAWVLRDWDVRAMARAADVSDTEAQRLERFRQSLIPELISPDAQ